MGVTRPKIALVRLPEPGERGEGRGTYLRRGSTHPCEHCKCCSCKRVCTMCNRNCTPSDSYFVPVVGCPDFIDMQETAPVRYTYRSGYEFEFKVHLPGSR